MTMMTFGVYRFELGSAAYQRLERTATYRWPSQDRIGRSSAAQYTGSDLQTIDLDGVIYPGFRGGLGQIDQLRTLAGLGIALPLIAGTGRYYGRWAVEELKETGTIFTKDGRPRKIDFSMRLKAYGEDFSWLSLI